MIWFILLVLIALVAFVAFSRKPKSNEIVICIETTSSPTSGGSTEDNQLDPYHSRSVRNARAVGILASWAIWILTLFLMFAAADPRLVVLMCVLALGCVPYIVSIKLVEPWLMKRIEKRLKNHDPGGRIDDG